MLAPLLFDWSKLLLNSKKDPKDYADELACIELEHEEKQLIGLLEDSLP